jgi:hypothetical protein
MITAMAQMPDAMRKPLINK